MAPTGWKYGVNVCRLPNIPQKHFIIIINQEEHFNLQKCWTTHECIKRVWIAKISFKLRVTKTSGICTANEIIGSMKIAWNYNMNRNNLHNSSCRWLIDENAKVFWSYNKRFWIFPRERNCKILIGLCK